MAKVSIVVILICLVFFSSLELCRGQSPGQIIYKAKILIQEGSNYASLEKFDRAKEILVPLESKDAHRELVEYYLGYIEYQKAVIIHRSDENKASDDLDSAIMYLKKAVEKNDSLADAHALLSSCYGIKISISPMSGIWRGPKSNSELNKAEMLSPENPRVALIHAISKYNTPAIFGGGKEKGFEALKKAADLFSVWETSDSLQPDWGRELVYAWIGIAHLDRKEFFLARKAFDKALEINPDYGWIKNVLVKKVESEEKSNNENHN